MLIYRVCNKLEITNLINNRNFDKIGSNNYFNNNYNNHNYLPNTFYMHFFKNKEDIFYLSNTLKRFICTFDIDENLLNKYQGIGKYINKINLRKDDYVIEYAIPSNLISLVNLKSIEVLPLNFNYYNFLQTKDYQSTFIYREKEHKNVLNLKL